MQVNVSYNPDVISCLANLSSDEVFTPPGLANQMLDLLPPELWSSPEVTFLDPAAKEGVFLREIVKRLDKGLAQAIPDKQQRINHILTKQVFAIAITELTGLLARRSVYCSKTANGQYSIATAFKNRDGNIRFQRTEHDWRDGKCQSCGASQSEYDREEALESHAYEFIHTQAPEDIFDMKFDVIVGNPPYQLSDGGHGRSASPIYPKFVDQAMKLKPRYLTMIIPARWLGGGKGLNDFRAKMLADRRIRRLVDYENANDPFPGVDIAGGICYFLWDRDNPGETLVTNISNGTQTEAVRVMDEFPVYVRQSEAIPIIRKVLSSSENRVNEFVSASKPFGLRTFERPRPKGDLVLRWQNGEGPFPSSEVTAGHDMIQKWKVIVSYAAYDHAGNPGKDGRRRIFSRIDVIPPGTICNETYLVVGSYDSELEARNLVKYMQTRFFRFLVAQFMYSQHITRETYSFVPVLDMSRTWTDIDLAKRYSLTEDEVDFINSKIRQMGPSDD